MIKVLTRKKGVVMDGKIKAESVSKPIANIWREVEGCVFCASFLLNSHSCNSLSLSLPNIYHSRSRLLFCIQNHIHYYICNFTHIPIIMFTFEFPYERPTSTETQFSVFFMFLFWTIIISIKSHTCNIDD